MNVIEVFEVLTDNKKVERHIVQNSELLHLFFLFGVKDRKAQRYFLPGLDCSRSRLHADCVLTRLRRRSLDERHLALRTIAGLGRLHVRVHRTREKPLFSAGFDREQYGVALMTLSREPWIEPRRGSGSRIRRPRV